VNNGIVKDVVVFSFTLILCIGLFFGLLETDGNKRERIAVVVMDVWEEYPWQLEDAENEEARGKIQVWRDWWYGEVQDNLRDKVVPFLTWARLNNITVVFSNMAEEGWDKSLSPLVEHNIYNEPIINLTGDLDVYLEAKNIETIYYVGYATNNCVVGKPTGMKAMAGLDYKVVLVEDCSLSGAYQILTHSEALELAVELGEITTSREVMEKFDK
jgi:hypothetical protein